jgi:hypothetical protein
MRILDHCYASIDLEASHSLAHTIWHPTTAEMREDEYLALFGQIADLFAQHRVALWLGDATHFRMAVSPEVQQWIATEFIPKVLAAGLAKMALVLPLHQVGNLSVERSVSEIQDQNGEMQVRYFAEVADARDWLLMVGG